MNAILFHSFFNCVIRAVLMDTLFCLQLHVLKAFIYLLCVSKILEIVKLNTDHMFFSWLLFLFSGGSASKITSNLCIYYMPSALYILKSNFIKMDLIRLYHDHDTQSSNSSEEVTIVKKEIAIDVAKSRIPRKIEYFREHKVPNGRLLHRHIDKTHQNITNFSVWLNDIDKRLHSCLGLLNYFTHFHSIYIYI